MPAHVFSRAPLPSPGSLFEPPEDQSLHFTGLPWEPLGYPLTRVRGIRAGTAFFGEGVDAEVIARGAHGVPSSFKDKVEAKADALENQVEKKLEGRPAARLEFTMRDGKTVDLCGEDRKCCNQSCEKLAVPHKEDVSQAAVGSASMAKLGETKGVEQDDCKNFCLKEFPAACFPGDSTVVVRNRGRIALEELRVGDPVLSVRQASNSQGWELCFDEVLAFLHRDPDAEREFLQVRHELGQVHLTADHLLFAQSEAAGTADRAAPIFASKVCIGDRVLVPWIDGSLTAPKVLQVQAVQKRGLYAPLLESGALLVDGTAASCYAIPENLRDSFIYHHLAEVASAASLQATYHALFLPLRLACRTAAGLKTAGLPSLGQPSATKGADLPSKASLSLRQPKASESIHPYAWALYAGFSSVVA